jgi:hypothetical protein
MARLKMRKDRIDRIRTVITDFVERVGREACIDHAEKHNPVRFRWDMFWAGCRACPDGLGFDLYADGINDNHVDSVLRLIVAELDLTKKGVA